MDADLQQIDHQRLARVESMLQWLLSTMAAKQVQTPSLEQARRIEAMGMPPWDTVTRETTQFQLWREAWDIRERHAIIEAAKAAVQEGTPDAKV